MLRDNIIFQGKYVDMKCYSCGNFGHLMNNCKIVHYVADNELLLRKVSTARPQQPRIPTPRITQKYKTLSNHFLTSESLRLLRINAINHAIPNYQPLFEINYQTSDETFFNVTSATATASPFFLSFTCIKGIITKNISIIISW